MANLVKCGKRGGKYLPRVMDGLITPGERYVEFVTGEHVERGQMPPIMYTADVWHRTDGVRDEYQLQITEDEMIRICGDWLSKLASRRYREKLSEQRKAKADAA